MARKKLIWKLVLVAVLLTAVFFPGILKYQQLKARQQKLSSGIDKLRISEADLIEQQDKLKNDPTYIEKVAREKLQVANKGEIIVRVEDRDGR